MRLTQGRGVHVEESKKPNHELIPKVGTENAASC